MTGEEYLYLVKTYGISVQTGRVPNLWDASVQPHGRRTETAVGTTPEGAVEKLAKRFGWLQPERDLPLLTIAAQDAA